MSYILDASLDSDGESFLADLTALNLDELLAQPSALSTQAHHLTSSLTSLTHSSYPAFISIHHASTALHDSLTSLNDSLSSLVSESLPALQSAASAWKDRTDGVLAQRKKARVVLEQHDKIRDLLDIPVLIDTSVRNGYYAEALSLAAHANSIASAYSTPPPVVASVVTQVKHSINQMLLALLTTLYEPNRKVPALWKAVNFLRKMDIFQRADAEEQLAVIFLAGRESCLSTALIACGRDVKALIAGLSEENILPEKDKDDLTRYLKKYIDVWREGVHDTVTQFMTIFLERAPTAGDSLTALHHLLTTYATYALNAHLLTPLPTYLPHVSTALPSILTQLTYCGTAFARIGMDFRGALEGLFSRAVQNSFSSELTQSLKDWQRAVNDALSGPSDKGPQRKRQSWRHAPVHPSQWLVSSSSSSPPPAEYDSSTPAHVPPPVLGSYPPIAHFTNAVLSSLNHLRLLAPTCIIDSLVQSLERVLIEGGRSYIAYAKECEDAITKLRWEFKQDGEKEREMETLKNAGQVYFKILVPFISRALLEGIYNIKGVSQTESLAGLVSDWDEWASNTST